MTGFINVNKEEGVSSAKEVAAIKRITGLPCGHMGTLDPMASGVLPVAIGNAARLFDYFLEKRKVYLAEFQFGTDSDTLDTTGLITETGGYVPDQKEINDVLREFCGEIMQIPPRYSAKNVAGKRGYELARAGIDFELAPKKVTIYDVALVDKTNIDTYSFKIECGGGTYIRSLARDIAKRLGTKAVMSSLVRVQSGVFTLENSVKTKQLNKENIAQYIISTDSILPYENFYPQGQEAKRLFNGLPIKTTLCDGIYKIYYTDGTFYGLGCVNQSILKIRTKLC